MGVREKIRIGWGDETFEFLPTTAAIVQIEQRIDTIGLSVKLAQGERMPATVARFLTIVMQVAGANVTEDEVKDEILAGGAESAEAAYTLAAHLIGAMYTSPDSKKKAAAKPKGLRLAPAQS